MGKELWKVFLGVESRGGVLDRGSILCKGLGV